MKIPKVLDDASTTWTASGVVKRRWTVFAGGFLLGLITFQILRHLFH